VTISPPPIAEFFLLFLVRTSACIMSIGHTARTCDVCPVRNRIHFMSEFSSVNRGRAVFSRRVVKHPKITSLNALNEKGQNKSIW
jgi:hypothetical protein